MGFNFGSAIMGAASGFLEGGPYGAAIGGVAGGLSGGGTTTGNLAGNVGNSSLNAIDTADEAFQISMDAEQVRHSEQMQTQSTAFDEMMDEKSEQMREVNTLRDVQMAQRKSDNDITKKFIESISA